MQTTHPSSNIHSIDGAFYRYTFVGSGAQFRVYSIATHDGRSTGRVVKVPLDFAETKRAVIEPLRRLKQSVAPDEFDELANKRTYEIMRFKYDVPNLLQGIYGKDRGFMRRMGHLKMLQVPIPAKTSDKPGAFYLPTLYTQDLVITLDDYLQQFRMASNPYVSKLGAGAIRQLKSVVDQIIGLNFKIWEYGVFEFVFKPENFGIRFAKNGQAELIWMDLAEHITNIEEAERILAERRWVHATLPHKVDYQFMPVILQDYYIEACDKALTVDALRKHWRKKCIRAENIHARKLQLQQAVARTDRKVVSYWIARHTLAQSLYQGFSSDTIDDLQIPTHDVELLVNDHYYINSDDTTHTEEKIERHRAESGDGVYRVFPLLQPPNFSHNKDQL